MTEVESRRPGPFTPPAVPHIDVPALLADIKGRELVSLPELGERIGMRTQARKHAIHEGLIKPVPGRPINRGYAVPPDQALTLVLAASLALAAGVAIAVMLRGLLGAGVTGAAAAAVLEGLAG